MALRADPFRKAGKSKFIPSGLLLALVMSCSAPPLRPTAGTGENAHSEHGNGDSTKGEEQDPSDKGGEEKDPLDPKENTMGQGDPKDPLSQEPANPGKDPTVPAPKKLSLLFVSGGQDHIAVYSFNKETGAAALLKNHNISGAYATFLAINGKARQVFGVDERGSQILFMSVDPSTGVLSDNAKLPTSAGPAHVSVNASGTAAFVANYGAGTVQSFAVDGKTLKAKSTKAPGPKAHAAHLDITQDFLYVPCLGSGIIAQYSVAADGSLSELSPESLSVGSKGPRHMAMHPNGKFSYLMNEYEGSVQALNLNAGSLSLNAGQVPSTTSVVAGNTGAEIQVHPNGKFLYSSNRGDDSIAIYSIAENGTVSLKKTVKTGGKVPRHFSLDASGTWMTVANQGSGSVTFFAVDKNTGELSPGASSLEFSSAQFAEIVDFIE